MTTASLPTDASRTQPTSGPRWLGAVLGIALAGAGCKSASAGVGLAKSDNADEAPKDVPVPPADGPKLLALRTGVPVLERPAEGARKLGELVAGGAVARSREPYGRAGCPGGWYAVRPRGFVCAGQGAALEAELAKVLPAAPDLGKPLPYRYGRARTQGTPAYAGVPGRAALAEAEPDLGRHLAKMERGAEALLGAGANDVPLDARGAAAGPPVLLPVGEGVNEKGQRSEAGYFAFANGDAIAPLVPLIALGGDLDAKALPLRKGTGVAITRSVTAGPAEGGGEGRRFGVTPEGRLVPADRLQPALGSAWHGIDIEKVGLPVAFVHKFETQAWSLGRGEAKPTDEELERHAAVPLTGRFRTVEGVRYEEAREGFWLRAQDLVIVMRRTKLPEFAKGSQKWLDVSLANQTLTAYEGQKPVYATLISSGRDMLGDPAASASTVRGNFRVRSKHVTRDVDPREVQEGFDVAHAPWVMEFEPGYALTGMYWSDAVGEAHGFHDVAMTPIDARRIWTWAEPELPEGWHAVYSADGEGTYVSIRP